MHYVVFVLFIVSGFKLLCADLPLNNHSVLTDL